MIGLENKYQNSYYLRTPRSHVAERDLHMEQLFYSGN